MEKKQKYHLAADVIRVIAILGVVVIHTFTEFVNNPLYFQNAAWWFANSIDSAVRVSVPLFIMLSGFLLLNQDRQYSVKEFLKKRFYKIGISLLVWPVVYYFWTVYLHFTVLGVIPFIYDYLSLSIYYHLYFLFLIAGIYLVTPIIKTFLQNASKQTQQYALILTVLFTITITLLKYFTHINVNLATVFTIFIPYLCFYLGGDYFRNVKLTKKQIFLVGGTFIILVIFTAFANMLYMLSVHWSKITNLQNANYDRYFYDYLSINVTIMSFLAFILLLQINIYKTFFEKPSVKKIIHHLSKASFGIYLIHPLLMSMFDTFILTHFNITFIPELLFLFLRTIIILVVSYIFVTTAQKISFLRLIFG